MRSFFGWPVTLLVLGVLLTLKDDVFALLTVTLDWLQHAEGMRLLIASNWRNYRHTLTPTPGADIAEMLGVVVIAVALVLMARRFKARASHDSD